MPKEQYIFAIFRCIQAEYDAVIKLKCIVLYTLNAKTVEWKEIDQGQDLVKERYLQVYGIQSGLNLFVKTMQNDVLNCFYEIRNK